MSTTPFTRLRAPLTILAILCYVSSFALGVIGADPNLRMYGLLCNIAALFVLIAWADSAAVRLLHGELWAEQYAAPASRLVAWGALGVLLPSWLTLLLAALLADGYGFRARRAIIACAIFVVIGLPFLVLGRHRGRGEAGSPYAAAVIDQAGASYAGLAAALMCILLLIFETPRKAWPICFISAPMVVVMAGIMWVRRRDARRWHEQQ